MYLGQARLTEVEELLGPLNGAENIGAVTFRARLAMARQDYASARQTLEQAIRVAPDNAWLWEVLSHALLQEGRDLTAAERALRRVLELEPGNVQPRYNLGVLLRNQGAVA
jgi:Flp pilus assembly protein TadD